MALFLRDPYYRYHNSFENPMRLFDQHFGNSLLDEDILLPHSMFFRNPSFANSALHPLRFHSRQESGISELKSDKDKFQMILDVQQFKPEELNVKIVDNTVVVEGKHEERADDHGYISRQFVRRYVLPEEVKPENVVCNISSDGVLEISAPRHVAQLPANEIQVPITQTNQPAITNKGKPEALKGNEEQKSGGQ